MSEVDASPSSGVRARFNELPRWLRIGLIAAVTIIVVLIVSVIVRLVLQTPTIPLGVTAANDLKPGSCLLEPGGVSEQYTVVGCSTPHQQQVIARVDLAFPGVDYTADESLAIFAEETCKRLLEYRLFLTDDLIKTDYETAAVNPPTLAEYEAGETETLCSVLDNHNIPDQDGQSEDLTVDLYRPMPQ